MNYASNSKSFRPAQKREEYVVELEKENACATPKALTQ